MGKNNINLTNGLFTRKEEYPTSRLGEEEMQQRLVSTGFGFLYYLKENIPSHKTHVSKAGLSSTDKESFQITVRITRTRNSHGNWLPPLVS